MDIAMIEYMNIVRKVGFERAIVCLGHQDGALPGLLHREENVDHLDARH